MIASKLAGGIIGKAGGNIQKLRNDNNARVQIADSRGSPDRVLTINSDLEACSNVLKALFTHLEIDSNNEFDLRFLIHQSLAGCVIGKSGATIMELRNQFGCSVKVFPDNLPFSSDRILQVIGTEDQCIKAFLQIFGKLLKDTQTRGQVLNYNADNYDPNYANRYGGYIGASKVHPRGNRSRFNARNDRYSRDDRARPSSYVSPWNQPAHTAYSQIPPETRAPASYAHYGSDPRVTSQVSIKNDMVGALIGRRGETINSIRVSSKATIQIDDPKGGPDHTDRIITITGTPDQIRTAQFLLQQCIRQNAT